MVVCVLFTVFPSSWDGSWYLVGTQIFTEKRKVDGGYRSVSAAIFTREVRFDFNLQPVGKWRPQAEGGLCGVWGGFYLHKPCYVLSEAQISPLMREKA